MLSLLLLTLMQIGNYTPMWDTKRDFAVIEDHTPRGIERYVSDEVIIRVKHGVRVDDAERWIESRGGAIIGAVSQVRALRVRLPHPTHPREFRASSMLEPWVDSADLNHIPSCTLALPMPDDTYFGTQWHLDNTGQQGGFAGADIEARVAWTIQRGSPSITVAVLDTGIITGHPEFGDRLLDGYDFVDEDGDPSSSLPHGSQVAGILGAATNNGFGFAAVDWRCRVLPLRVTGAGATTFDVIQGIIYAVEHGASVINMSLGISPFSGGSAALNAALAYAAGRDVIAVAAAGNAGANGDSVLPASSEWCISIGATNRKDRRAAFSNFGDTLDFVAPGVGIGTVNPTSILDVVSSLAFGGTSASSPIGAGIASLLLAEQPDLTVPEVYELLRVGAEDQVGDSLEDVPGWDPYYGHGRLNAARSLQALCGCTGAEDFRGTPPGKLSATGRQWLTLNAGPDHAGAHYIVLGTFSGTSPGLPLGNLHVPLNQDHYFYVSSHQPSPLIRGPIGRLDEDGRARAVLALPASLPPVLVGATLHHAYVLLEGGKPVYVSSPVAAEVGG